MGRRRDAGVQRPAREATRQHRANPRVALHLNDDGRGNDIVIVEGEARIDESTPLAAENAAYLAKYGEWIREELNSPEEMATIYNIPLWIRPIRGRAFGA